jgi:hypothetical protein
MNTKRSIKFKFINCLLKLNSEIIGANAFPPDDELRPHIRDIRAEVRRAAEAIQREGEVVAGYRADMMYRERFNLSGADVDLLRQEIQQGNQQKHSFEKSREIYFRNLLQPYKIYAFMSLQRTPRCFYVAENKSFAGKDKVEESEAASRLMSVAWLEASRELDDGVFVQPVNVDKTNLELLTYSIAELLRAAGHFEPVGPRESARSLELRYESSILDFDLRVFVDSVRVVEQGSPWTFQLSEGIDCEQHFFDTVDPTKLTKMQLARFLIVLGRANNADWKRLSYLPKAELATRCTAAPT